MFLFLLLQVTYISETTMAQPVFPRDEQWMMYMCFVIMYCLWMLAHLRSLAMNVVSLTQVGFVHTGVGGTFKWCCYRNHFGHAYVGLRNGKFKLRNFISNILLHTNRDTTCTCRNDAVGGLQRTDGSIYQHTIQNVRQENAVMRQLIACTICNTRDRRVVFLPCGHFLTCKVCGQETNTCTACGLPVTSRVVVNQ